MKTTIFRGVRDILPTKIDHRHLGEGHFGQGTYFALSSDEARYYATMDSNLWGIVFEFQASLGRTKSFTCEDLEPNNKYQYPNLTKHKGFDAYLLLQGEGDYNPPEGGEQVLIPVHSEAKIEPISLSIYFADSDKTAKKLKKSLGVGELSSFNGLTDIPISKIPEIENFLKDKYSL